ncbi:MAG TPA: universal stress protein, partial [Nitrospira sp.]|nr:universal stress protein [Nitrospira sp.]
MPRTFGEDHGLNMKALELLHRGDERVWEMPMKILVAIDGSNHAYEGVRALRYLARADQVILLHVLNVPRPAYPMMVPEVAEELYREREDRLRTEGDRLLDRIQSLLPPHTGPSTRFLRIGSPADVIATVGEQEKVHLIVMGSRGLGSIKERVLGSVSHRIVTLAPCAKLIVNGPIKAIRQILVPLAGSFDREEAIRFLQTKPFLEPPELNLFTVLPSVVPPWPIPETAAAELEEAEMESAHRFLADGAIRLQLLGYKTRTRVVVGTPAES